ncbi:MAG: uroporphyrinogen-III synthase [Gammaproteobacteria bacterium]
MMNNSNRQPHILITRPLKQAQALSEALQNIGVAPIIFPTLEIVPCINHPSLQQVQKDFSMIDIAIFTSANAVECALNQLTVDLFLLSSHLRIAAIGDATARKLNEYGLEVSMKPVGRFASEGLLAHPELQHVSQKNIALFCGEASRPLLADTLKQRGAKVRSVIVYRRQIPQLDVATHIMMWQQHGVDMIICTSKEALNNLMRMVNDNVRQWLQTIPLLVLSNSVADVAREYGWCQQIMVSAQADDSALIDSVKRWLAQRITK